MNLSVADLIDLPDTNVRADEVGLNPANDDHPLTEIGGCPMCHSALVGTYEIHDDRGVRLRIACRRCE